MLRVIKLLTVVLLLCSLWTGGRVPAVRAAGVVGDGTPGSCTDVNFGVALAGGGLVTFNCGPNPVIIPIATKDMWADAVIDGGGLVTFSGLNSHRLFTVNGSARLTLKNLTVTAGYNPSGQGGAILNYATLVVDNVLFTANNTPPGSLGGAIASSGLLTVTNSSFTHNGSGGGGAIYNAGPAAISNTTFISNTAAGAFGGGAVFHFLNALSITGSTFIGNAAPYNSNANTGGKGGAIAISSTVSISDSSFTGNSAFLGGAISNMGTLTLSQSALNGNTAQYGGGIDDHGLSTISQTTLTRNSATYGAGIYAAGDMTIFQSTLSGNISFYEGGGVRNSGVLTLTQSTISGNSGYDGGGIMNSGTLTLTHVTLTGNTSAGKIYDGAGISNYNNLYLTNVLFAHNRLDNGESRNCVGQAAITAVFSLSTDLTCLPAGNGNRLNVPQTLTPLRDNGGHTLTHLPVAGSEALDHGTCVTGLTVDQRGLPRLAGAACDIGAVERQPSDVDLFLLLVPLVLR